MLFTIPLMFILATMFWYEMARQTGYRVVLAAAAALGGLFVWDNVAMFPYNYVYFNLPTRMLADDGTYLTDLWGFSLKEAARLPVVDDPNAVRIGNPLHLVTPYVAHPHRSCCGPATSETCRSERGRAGVLCARPGSARLVQGSAVRDASPAMGRILRKSFAASAPGSESASR